MTRIITPNFRCVSRNASAKDIKTAYYDKAKVLHPDANKINSQATASKFQEVSEAYEILGDTDKRRAYDTTTRPTSYDVYGRRTVRDEVYKSPRRSPAEPVNMSHIQHVYKTLNRADAQQTESPKFRPFEDHNFPGTAFNRFEYSRVWHPQRHMFIYVKKATAGQYNQEIMAKQRILQICVMVFMAGTMVFLGLNKTFYGKAPKPNIPEKPKLTREERMEYYLNGQRPPHSWD